MRSIHQLTLAIVSIGIASFLFSSPLSAQTWPGTQKCKKFPEIEAEFRTCTFDAYDDVKLEGNRRCESIYGSGVTFFSPDENQCYLNGVAFGPLPTNVYDEMISAYDDELARCIENRRRDLKCAIQEVIDDYATRP